MLAFSKLRHHGALKYNSLCDSTFFTLMPVQNFSTWDARNDTSYSQHVSLSNICSLKNLKKHENNCCAEGHDENHVAQKWRIRIVPALVFKIEHIHYMILGARTSFSSTFYDFQMSLPPSHSLSGYVPLGFLALKGQKQT